MDGERRVPAKEPQRRWLMLQVGTVLRRLPQYVVSSLWAETDFPLVRPWLTDGLRARIIAWSNCVALIVGTLAYCMLHQYYTERARWWFLGITVGVLVLTVACFMIELGTGPSTDWERASNLVLPETKAPPAETAWWLRVVMFLSFVWIALLIHWSGGPLLSPFATYGVVIIVLGQFLAGTVESHIALALVGVVSLVEVKVITRSKQNKVVERPDQLVVRVTAPDEGGRANTAVLRLLADHWQIPITSLIIVRGLHDRRKLIKRP